MPVSAPKDNVRVAGLGVALGDSQDTVPDITRRRFS